MTKKILTILALVIALGAVGWGIYKLVSPRVAHSTTGRAASDVRLLNN